jgi:hypothetical protein
MVTAGFVVSGVSVGCRQIYGTLASQCTLLKQMGTLSTKPISIDVLTSFQWFLAL